MSAKNGAVFVEMDTRTDTFNDGNVGGVSDDENSTFFITLSVSIKPQDDLNDRHPFEGLSYKDVVKKYGKTLKGAKINLTEGYITFPVTPDNINTLRVLVKNEKVTLTPGTVKKLRTLTHKGQRNEHDLAVGKRNLSANTTTEGTHEFTRNELFSSTTPTQKVIINPFEGLQPKLFTAAEAPTHIKGLSYQVKNNKLLTSGSVTLSGFNEPGIAEQMRKYPGVAFKNKKYNIPPVSIFDVTLWAAKNNIPIQAELYRKVSNLNLSDTKPHNGGELFTVETLKKIPVSSLPSFSPQRVKKFENFGISNLHDLFFLTPRRYLDRSTSTPIKMLQEGEDSGFIGTITSIDVNHVKRFVKVHVSDTSGNLPLTFFNATWMVKKFSKGDEVLVYGKPERWKPGSPISMTNPIIEHYEPTSLPVVPIYPQSGKNGITSVEVRRAIREAAVILPKVQDPLLNLPDGLQKFLPACDTKRALQMVHFPSKLPEVYIGKNKLAFDELFNIQLAFLKSKIYLESEPGFTHEHSTLTDAYIHTLPYSLTNAQKKALTEIKKDMRSSQPMHRLLQGDVGAGKAQPVSTEVATVNGWEKMGNINVGDVLINPEGGLSEVESVHELGEREIFTIHFSDGVSVNADREHLWCVFVVFANENNKTSSEKFPIGRFVNITTERLETFLNSSHFDILVPLTHPYDFSSTNEHTDDSSSIDSSPRGHGATQDDLGSAHMSLSDKWNILYALKQAYAVTGGRSAGGAEDNTSTQYGFRSETREACESFTMEKTEAVKIFVSEKEKLPGAMHTSHEENANRALNDNWEELLDLLRSLGCFVKETHRHDVGGKKKPLHFLNVTYINAMRLNTANDEAKENFQTHTHEADVEGEHKKLHAPHVEKVHNDMGIFRIYPCESLNVFAGGTLCKKVEKVTRTSEYDVMRCIKVSHDNGLYLTEGSTVTHNTTVAVSSLLLAVSNGKQAALMAPTEILAKQLYEEIRAACEKLNASRPVGRKVKVEFFSNQLKGKTKEAVLNELQSGHIHIAVGTHALLSEDVVFDNLSTVVIDEQHRFGVEQRNTLREKTLNRLVPDTLVMTATPIPRTAIMTIFGDLELTTLNELPPGRTPVTTVWVNEEPNLENGKIEPWNIAHQEIEKGRQVFVVCPLVEESETLEVASANETYEHLTHGALKGRRVGLVHGQQKAKERETIMEKFKNGDLDVLVSTTVVEVGVNIPNATLMIILDPSRFGISQLHQLRGRVGRSDLPSTCVLYGSAKNPDTSERLNALVSSNDGFELSEVDLKIRGHGSVFGSQQSGVSDLKVADLREHSNILETVKSLTREMLNYSENETVQRLLSENNAHPENLEWLGKS